MCIRDSRKPAAQEPGKNWPRDDNADWRRFISGHSSNHTLKFVLTPVSYTHLDVYKRQPLPSPVPPFRLTRRQIKMGTPGRILRGGPLLRPDSWLERWRKRRGRKSVWRPRSRVRSPLLRARFTVRDFSLDVPQQRRFEGCAGADPLSILQASVSSEI